MNGFGLYRVYRFWVVLWLLCVNITPLRSSLSLIIQGLGVLKPGATSISLETMCSLRYFGWESLGLRL